MEMGRQYTILDKIEAQTDAKDSSSSEQKKEER